MNKSDKARAKQINQILSKKDLTKLLPGIQAPPSKDCFISQIVESIRRVRYIEVIKKLQLSPLREDAQSELFDPLKASLRRFEAKDQEEAFWLVFLATYFGRHHSDGWELTRCIYRGEKKKPWTWKRVHQDKKGFLSWITYYYKSSQVSGEMPRFGNHRKYETLKPNSQRSMGVVVESYLAWVAQKGTHRSWIDAAESNSSDPGNRFDYLYSAMKVLSFGRTGKFDYWTMVGKLGLAHIRPISPYLRGATGPLRGAKLLFDGDARSNSNIDDLEEKVRNLGSSLGVGMQEMEDSLCNWQKSPASFIPFRG